MSQRRPRATSHVKWAKNSRERSNARGRRESREKTCLLSIKLNPLHWKQISGLNQWFTPDGNPFTDKLKNSAIFVVWIRELMYFPYVDRRKRQPDKVVTCCTRTKSDEYLLSCIFSLLPVTLFTHIRSPRLSPSTTHPSFLLLPSCVCLPLSSLNICLSPPFDVSIFMLLRERGFGIEA